MAGFIRHFLALTHKNYINFKRTKLLSLLEIILPAIFIGLVALSHKLQNPINKEEQSYLNLAASFYPVTEPNGIRYVATQNLTTNLTNFIDFSNISQEADDFYRRNPNFFWPSHCYSKNTVNSKHQKIYGQLSENEKMAPRRNLTAIAYIQENNQVEYDVIAQLKIIFAQQQALAQGVYHQYKLLKFNTKQEIWDYVKEPNYSLDEDKPGICFGFDIKKFSDSRYAVELIFDDQIDQDQAGAGIPKQADPVWDPINPQANLVAFSKYVNNGYSFMQNLIANTILRLTVNQTASVAMIIVPQNQQPYSTDPLIEQILVQFLPYAMLFAYFLPVFRTCQRMVAEKETQVRDSMRMMGLDELAYWCSWLFQYLIVNIVIASLSTLILFTTIFQHSSWGLVWLFFFLYGLALFGFVVLVQAFFQNTTYCQIFTLVIYVALFFVGNVVKGQYVPENKKMWSGLIPQVTLSLMVPNLGAFEAAGIGLTIKNCDTIYKNYVYSRGYWLLLIDFVVFSLAGIYLDNVMPRQTGMQRPFSYMFNQLKASYWDFFELFKCGKKPQGYKFTTLKNKEQRRMELLSHDKSTFETKYVKSENFEQPDVALLQLEKKRRFLKIEDLTKEYSNGFKAVNGINIRMYEGQIFALLGHNGAGKSSTIKMLTGMVQPTQGEAYVYGYKIFSQDMDTLRRYMGVCPQHNVLFDLLTPFETIQVFQEFKGSSGSKKEKLEEVEKILKDVGIWEFKNTQGRNLSGGNKRKLSVAIALCGKSRFVMLDEPTAGMDLQARRNLWNMLRSYRSDRIIILTTHYMDEADVLGDRIGIMQDGKLVTIGSSLFLKKRYGVGYNLTLVKQPVNELETYNVEYLKNFMKQNLGSDIIMLSDIGSEIVFQIPSDYSSKFGQFFATLDAKLNQLKISGYGVSVTSLEEVFLKVGQQSSLPKQSSLEEQQNAVINQFQNEIETYSIVNQNHSNLLSNIRAMLFKRVKLEARRWKQVIYSEILIPLVFFLVGIAITQMDFLFDSPQRTLLTSLYPLQQRPLINLSPVIASNFSTNQSSSQSSIQSIVANLPCSYTLVINQDFNVTYKNYTEKSLQYQESGQNLTDFNLFEQFNQDSYQMRTLGDPEPYRFGSYLFYQADTIRQQYKVVNFVNTTSQDSAAAFPQFLYEAILKTATNNSNFQFKMTSTPLPISQRHKDQAKQTSTVALISVLAIGLSLIPANIIGSILNEKQTNLKHLQVVSGLNLFAYHLVNLICDIIKAEIVVLICCSTFFMFQLEEYYYALIVLSAWPLSVIPFTHATAFLFDKQWTAQFFTILINLVAMFVLPFIVSTYLFSLEQTLSGEKINNQSLYLPQYAVGRSFIFCGFNEQLSRFRFASGLSKVDQEAWSSSNLSKDLVVIGIHFCVWTISTFLFEFFPFQSQKVMDSITYRISKLLQNKKQRFSKEITDCIDEDVQAEESRVSERNIKELQVRVSKFGKTYTSLNKQTVAVKQTSFGLQFGECFALLGVNGAGKTTTFKCLTNEVQPTSGQVSIGGFDVNKQFGKARKLIGFCPQENVLFDQLSVEEHLQFYARLKGIKNTLRQSVINYTLKQMNLDYQREKQAGSLSGGNKRKLQVAIAIIGNPPIILLDEPSAGMDPEARRFMWSVIQKLNNSRQQCAVILTTHSMEEAEALSTKMGIMVSGGLFRCFGSVQHIKNKFGTGYEIEVKIRPIDTKKKFQRQVNDQLKTYDEYTFFRDSFEISEFITQEPLSELVEKMRKNKYLEELLAEIRPGGLGDELVRESKFDKSGKVQIPHLIDWAHNMRFGTRVVRLLAKEFGQIVLLEQFSNYFKLRVQRQDKSIGYLFGLLESNKVQLGISEYSVSQTTLEQIFQLFANSSRVDVGQEDLTKITFKYNPDTEFGLDIIPNQQNI